MKLHKRACRISAMVLCAALAAAFSGCAENGVPAAPTAQIEEPEAPTKDLELPAANNNDIAEVSLQQNAAPTVVSLPDETAPAEDIRESECPPLANVALEIDRSGKYNFFSVPPKEEIHAMNSGEVVFADYPLNCGLGFTVVVKQAEDEFVAYSHMDIDKGFAVKVGDKVESGQLLGYTGQSGRVSMDEFALGVTYFKTMPDFSTTM